MSKPPFNLSQQQQQNSGKENENCSNASGSTFNTAENTFNAGQANIPNNTHDSGTHEPSRSGNETLDDEPSQEEWEELKAGDRRHESDAMLAHAYREMAEASRDVAIWSQATAVSLSPDLMLIVIHIPRLGR